MKAGDSHEKVRVSEFLKACWNKDTSDDQDKTHQILRKFCLDQNGKRGSPELNLLPVDNTSTETEFYFNCLICC